MAVPAVLSCQGPLPRMIWEGGWEYAQLTAWRVPRGGMDSYSYSYSYSYAYSYAAYYYYYYYY